MKFLMTWKNMIGLVIVLTLVCGIQALAYDKILDETKIWEGECSFVEWDGTGSHLTMIIDCNGQKVFTREGSILYDYIQNPQNMNCRVFGSGEASCIEEKEGKEG
ncbi:hypothetical protein ACFL3E_01120 [Patescibacteria group bacterium]